MSDPYQVLNISPQATDDEVKHAYRELARKYHPDNYHDNPLADLAQEKMKEINEAYEQIQKQRRSGAPYNAAGTNGGYSYGAASSDPLMQRVRLAISSGNVTLAERLLNEAAERGAEWNFLMGVVCSRRGWMDDAKRYMETACRMEPDNVEYKRALEVLTNGGYRPQGYRQGGTMTFGDDACARFCTGFACFSATGCPIFCCM